ncbi:MAG: hypothetical protein ACREL9_00395 [Gemmatimonadales bacterium]
MPLALEPGSREQALAWSAGTLPQRHTAVRFRWRYQDERLSAGGRGTVRIAPPDSLRFDYAGPFGLGSGAAVVIGDSLLWADPPEGVRSLVPAIQMLWAALGTVRPPAPGAAVFSRQDPPRTIWRFVQGDDSAVDTLDYVATGSETSSLEAEWRRGGRVVARSRAVYEDHAMPASARIDFPEAPARFEFTVVAVDTAPVFVPALWRRRR